MATEYTPNANLYEWNKTDTKQTTITEMASNAVKIDNKIKDYDTHVAKSASLVEKGHVQLSSDINSTTETMAATPKSVKTVNDKIGLLPNLTNADKSSVVSALNEHTNTLSEHTSQLAETMKKTPWVSIEQYENLKVGDDWQPAIQKAIDDIVATGKKGTIRLRPDTTYKINSKLTIDISLVSIVSEGALIDASSITIGEAILFNGSIAPPFFQSTINQSGWRLKGAGKATTTTGIIFNTVDGLGATSHINLNNLSISDFGTGIIYKNHAYILNHYTVDIFNCGVCVDTLSATTDGGERMTFVGCTLFNSDLAVRALNGGGAFHFVVCSLDYNAKQVEINGSKVFLTDCHIENSGYSQAPFSVTGNGGYLSVKGGWILINGSSANMPYVVDCSTTENQGGGAYFSNVFMNTLKGSNDMFATGNGTVVLEHTQSYNTTNLPTFVSQKNNLLFDGGFEDTVIRDNIFIANDTTTITDRFVGTNVQIALDSSQFRSGAKSLKITKVGASGTTARVGIAVPIKRKHSILNSRVFFKKPGAEAGNLSIQKVYCQLNVNKDGVPTLSGSLSRGSHNINTTSSPQDWTEYKDAEPFMHAPEWATHYIILIDLLNFPSGSIYIDDVLFTEM